MPLSAFEIARRKTAKRDTDRLLFQALQLGVDIPRHPHWWWDDSEELTGLSANEIEYATTHYLTPEGIAGIKKLIRAEKRNNIEWSVKTVGTLIAAATGLVGALIGLQAVMKK